MATARRMPDVTLPLDTILCGDCLDVLRGLPDASVDAIVTDPPYGLGAAPDMLEVLRAWLAGEAYTPRGKGGFMGKAWDAFVPGPEYWRECLRVLKPGGHALVFAGTRTWDVMGLALRLAGFELRDTLQWLYGSGFPKSLDVGKAIDKAAGAQRDVVGRYRTAVRTGVTGGMNGSHADEHGQTFATITAPATDAARQWDGWGTALKPAWEPIIVCRKPLGASTVAGNVLAHGVGALNIGASRVGASGATTRSHQAPYAESGWRTGHKVLDVPAGRWPANLLLSHAPDCGPHACSLWCPVRELDAQSGVSHSRASGYDWGDSGQDNPAHVTRNIKSGVHFNDTGGASRYFPTFRYVAKASRRERNRGCEGLPERAAGVHDDDAYVWPLNGDGTPRGKKVAPRANHHPTVKPLALMSWLITLITPAGGVVLDPFAGSGSTLVAAKQGGWRYVGIEREAEYVAIAEARLAAVDSRRTDAVWPQ